MLNLLTVRRVPDVSEFLFCPDDGSIALSLILACSVHRGIIEIRTLNFIPRYNVADDGQDVVLNRRADLHRLIYSSFAQAQG